MIAVSLAIWFALLVLPDVPVRRWLETAVVLAPARRLNRISRGQVVLCSIVAMVGLALWSVAEQDGLLLFGYGLPDVGMLLGSVEFTGFIDIVTTAVLLAAGTQLRSLGAHFRALVALPGNRRRQRRIKQPRRLKPANDDEDGPALAVAA